MISSPVAIGLPFRKEKHLLLFSCLSCCPSPMILLSCPSFPLNILAALPPLRLLPLHLIFICLFTVYSFWIPDTRLIFREIFLKKNNLSDLQLGVDLRPHEWSLNLQTLNAFASSLRSMGHWIYLRRSPHCNYNRDLVEGGRCFSHQRIFSPQRSLLVFS